MLYGKSLDKVFSWKLLQSEKSYPCPSHESFTQRQDLMYVVGHDHKSHGLWVIKGLK